MTPRTRSSRERNDDDDTPSDPYRHLVLLVTFLFLVLEAGITKAFGVLLTPMVFQLDSNFASVGVIFSLPWTVAHFGAVFVNPLASNIGLTKISTAGGLIAGVAITTSSFARTTSALGTLFFLFGSLYDLTQSIDIQFYIIGVLQAICVGIFISLLVIKKRSGSTRSREL